MKNSLNLKLSRSLIFLLLFTTSFTTSAQLREPPKDGDREKYIYPVNPGKPGSLAGNMGELRSTHFHSGIDVRTNNQIGYPIVASKSGYISRISMSPSGYGNVMYVKHPDGNTTLYAHLDHFADPFAEYVLRHQYEQQTFDIDLYPEEDQFPVKQGELIAISGNTGSSGGPHLHFDIRDPNNEALDPLAFGFREIDDNLPPVVEKVAFVTLDQNSRINDQYGRFEFYVYRTGNQYQIKHPILAQGNIGIEVLAKDKFRNNDPFYGGVKYITMNVNGSPAFKQGIEKINLSETRGIYTLMNYKTLRTTGKRFYKLYIDDGNVLDFYQASPSNGRIQVAGTKDIKIDVAFSDTFENTSKLTFSLRPVPLVDEVKTLPAATEKPRVEWDENVLKITVRPKKGMDSLGSLATVYHSDAVTRLPPSYFNNVSSVFLVDLKEHFPDSIEVFGEKVVTHLRTMIPSGVEYKYFSDRVNISFPVNALFDTLYMNATFDYDGNEGFTLGDRTVPLSTNVTIDYAPSRPLDKDPRLGVYRVMGRSRIWLGGTWIDGRISFQSRELGSFELLTDTTPPVITPLSINNHTVRFRIGDDLSGINSYNAYIDGAWLLMHYDAKTGIIRSERADKTQPLNGELKLLVKDNAGNEKVYTHQLP